MPGGKIELHAYLAPDALRVLTGDGRAAVDADDALQITGPASA